MRLPVSIAIRPKMCWRYSSGTSMFSHISGRCLLQTEIDPWRPEFTLG